MATLTLSDVPEELLERLQLEAEQNRRSLQQETVARLKMTMAPSAQRPEVNDTIVALRRLHKKLQHLPPLDDAFIDRAKREGRL